MYLCIYMYIYIYIHVYRYIYIYIHGHTVVQVWMCGNIGSLCRNTGLFCRNTWLFWCRRKHTVGQICTCGNISLFYRKQEHVKHSLRALLRKSELFCENTMTPGSIKDRWRGIKQSICTSGNLGKHRNKTICTNELWILRTSRIYKSPDLVFPALLFPKQKISSRHRALLQIKERSSQKFL